jgi:hypothetical protein
MSQLLNLNRVLLLNTNTTRRTRPIHTHRHPTGMLGSYLTLTLTLCLLQLRILLLLLLLLLILRYFRPEEIVLLHVHLLRLLHFNIFIGFTSTDSTTGTASTTGFDTSLFLPESSFLLDLGSLRKLEVEIRAELA